MKKLVALSLLLPFFAHAQVDPSEITNSLTFIVAPESPAPHQNVTVRIESSSLDLDASPVTWKLNGAVLKSGQGITSIAFTAGEIGERSSVSVTIDAPTGTVTRTTDITPGAVDLLYQGNTYTPPFFKGLPLWGRQSRITLLAIPHVISGGKELSPSTLIYRWTLDNEVVGNASGAGRSTFTFNDTVLALPRTVSVDVLTDRNTVAGTASYTLSAIEPVVLAYENNPLLGLLFNREVGSSLTMTGKEVTFSAIPLYFTGNNKRINYLTYTWNTNGSETQTGDKVTFRVPDESAGQSHVNIAVLNNRSVTQGSEKNFLVQFGKR